MRLRRLSLERFGHFTDRAFDFGPAGDGPDFHIVYGPNEAGKTTTMQAVLRLFYGFPARDPYDFRHARANLQVSGVLEIDGAPRAFTRLSKRSGALRDANGTALPETALSAHLAGLDRREYEHLLCLDDATIEAGGEEIVNAEGDIGRLLFSAAAGLSDLSGVLDGVREAADALWKKRGRSTRIAGLKAALREVEQEIRAQDMTASAWKTLKRTLAQAVAAETEARAARDGITAEKARFAARRRALPLLGEIGALDAALAGAPETPDRLGIDPERLVALRSSRSTALGDHARLDAEIEKLDAARAQTPLDPALQDLAARLDELQDLAARDRSAALDLARRREEVQAAETAMQAAARELGGDADPDGLVVTQAQIVALETARQALRDAAAAARLAGDDLAELAPRLQAAQDAVGPDTGGKAPADAARIGALLLGADADRLATEHAAAVQSVAAAVQAERAALAALRLGARGFETVPDCPVSPAQASDWAERHAELSRQLQQATDARDAQRETAAARGAQAAPLRAASAGPDDAALEALLETREARWRVHAAALDAETARAFRAALEAHDAARAAVLAQAGVAGELRQLAQAVAEADGRAAAAEARRQEIAEARGAIETAVRDAAAKVGLEGALSPAAWADWVARHAQAAAAATARESAERAAAPVLARAEALRDAVAEALALPVSDFDAALAAARRAAEDEQARATQDARARETLAQLTRDHDRRATRAAEATAAAGAARRAWEGLVAETLGDRVAPATLEAALGPLRTLREEAATRDSAARRVDTMQADRTRFAEAVALLADTYGTPATLPPDATPAQIHAALQERAEENRAAQAEAARRAADRARAVSARDAAEATLRDIDAEVAALAAALPGHAGETDIDALRALVARLQRIIDDRATRAARERALLTELQVDDLAEARAALADLSPAAIEAALERAGSDLGHAEAALTAAIEARVAAERDLAAVSGDAEIAALVERKATLELELEEAAQEHLELSLGHALATAAIRRYRDSHRSEMMQATERAFASLTRGAYPRLMTRPDGERETLVAVDAGGASKQAAEMSKGTRFQLYLALRAAAYEQLVAQGTRLPFFCDDIFETFDEARTSAACRVMQTIGRSGQAIYLTHHRHVVEIAQKVCDTPPMLHEI